MVKKQRNKYIIPSIVVGLALIVSVSVISAVSAGVSLRQMIANVAGDKIAEGILGSEPVEDISLGAFPGTDVYERMHFKGGMVKNASFYAPLNWSGGTTSGETTVVTVAKMTNDTGKDLLCRDVFLDVSTARGSFSGLFAVGTTTKSGDDSLTVTTTVSLIASNALATTTTDIFNKEDDEGTDANVYWKFLANEVIAVSDTFTTGNATSAASFTAAGGFTGVGAVSAECWYR